MNLTDRAHHIVFEAFNILMHKISGGSIVVENEASMQLQLASILKTLGETHIFSTTERFSIELEKPFILANGQFQKSRSNRAKIDIWFSFTDAATDTVRRCAIELKFFKCENHREPNNRYDVFSDLSNLERYGDIADICVFLLGTDHPHYVSNEKYSSGTGDFDFRDGSNYEAGTVLTYQTEKPYGPPLALSNSYEFSWNHMENDLFFLPVEVFPVR